MPSCPVVRSATIASFVRLAETWRRAGDEEGVAVIGRLVEELGWLVWLIFRCAGLGWNVSLLVSWSRNIP
jgi:hypothetical protein